MAMLHVSHGARIADLACRFGAADGYGGEAPGAEYCDIGDKVTTDGHRMRDIVDFHLLADGGFWVCFDDVCREGTYDEALYLLAGRREIEGSER